MPEDEANGGVVRVTLKDVYLATQEISRSLDLLHTDLRIHMALPAHPASVAFMSDHEGRMRSIERWKYALPIAGFLAIGALIDTLVRHT